MLLLKERRGMEMPLSKGQNCVKNVCNDLAQLLPFLFFKRLSIDLFDPDLFSKMINFKNT